MNLTDRLASLALVIADLNAKLSHESARADAAEARLAQAERPPEPDEGYSPEP